MTMTHDQIHALRVVLETGSFARASAILQIDQSTVSKSISRLESRLGISILSRHGKGVTPTKAGSVLLEQVVLLTEHSKLAYELVQYAKEQNDDVTIVEQNQMRLQIAIASELSDQLIGPAFTALKQARCAGVELAVHPGSNLEEHVISGRVDIGLLCDTPTRPELHCVRLGDESMVIVCGPSLVNEVDRLLPRLHAMRDVAMLLPSWEHSSRRAIEQHARRAGLTFKVVAEMADLSALKTLVRQGLGYTILPYCAVAQEAERGHLCVRRLVGLGQSIGLSLISRPSAQARSEVVKAQDVLAACLRRSAELLRQSSIQVYPHAA